MVSVKYSNDSTKTFSDATDAFVNESGGWLTVYKHKQQIAVLSMRDIESVEITSPASTP